MSNRTVQRLMLESRRGHPIDSGMLRAMGISAALASHMVKSGRLKRLSQGVYLLTGDTLTRDGTIVFLTRRIAGLHVGGKTASPGRECVTTSRFAKRWCSGASSPVASRPGWASICLCIPDHYLVRRRYALRKGPQATSRWRSRGQGLGARACHSGTRQQCQAKVSRLRKLET